MNAFSSQFKNLCGALVLMVALFLSSAVSAATIHVDITAPGGGTGLPNQPYNNLQTAINAASSNPASPDTILIAQGTYIPSPQQSRSSSFAISNKNVSLQGGWINNSGTWTHDPANAVTILSGNINNTGSETDNDLV